MEHYLVCNVRVAITVATDPITNAYRRPQGNTLYAGISGDLLFKLGRFAEAQTEFARAASLTRNARERDFLLGRAGACTTARQQ